jgi:hypothetical protein
MIAAWLITIGGGTIGVGGLMLRDYFVWRRSQGLPSFRLPKFSSTVWVWVAVLTVFVGAGLVLPVLARPHESGCYRITARRNINEIGKALEMYADVNGANFPTGGITPAESLWMLYPKFIMDSRCLLNPNDAEYRYAATLHAKLGNKTVIGQMATALYDSTGFTYVEGCCAMDGRKIILYERAPFSGARHVFRANGDVDYLSEQEFQNQLLISH